MRLSVFTMAGALLIGRGADAHAQILTGRVVELGSDRAIVAASVGIVSGGQPIVSTESDSTGFFRLVLPQPGRYRIRVERLGYAPAETDSVEVGRTELVEVTISLRVTAVDLAPLMVVTRRAAAPSSEFYRRLDDGLRSGIGWFITRGALDSTSAMTVTSLLSRVPLVGMTHDNRGRPTPVMLSRGGCTPALFLNGAPLRFAAGETLDDMFDPGSLEGVEIYRNRMEVPFEIAGAGECGAIGFWTRQGEPSRGSLWRFLVAGGAVLGLLVVFRAM
ncbi:MAG TPA: carboxypeptidase regulatory-like domain-containing protein [Longimicrobiales bacterium]|nr:carboxypeptidase regulatory-like domain-containing protein [Longimicrobiales bacterium]